MATYVSYAPDAVISKAMFNFDAFGIANYKLTGIVRVSVSDSFSFNDYLTLGFNPGLYTSSLFSNEVAWTSQMTANIQEITGIFSSFANITFGWQGDYDTFTSGPDVTPNPADIGSFNLSDINITWIYRSDGTFSGISGGSSDNIVHDYTGGAGDIFLNSYAPKFDSDFTLGLNTRARQTLMHELGHSLGLSHPHTAYNPSTGVATLTSDYAATMNLGFQQLGFHISTAADMYKEHFTIMAYDDQQSLLPGSGLVHAHTPMILDVIALQQAYGEGPGTTGTGNDTINAGNAGYRTYFDKGGIDTINLSIYTEGAYLQMGVHITGANHLVGVAMSLNDAYTTIVLGDDPAHLRWFYGEYENADGSAYADVLYGNELANIIEGRGGADVLYGLAGNDTVGGGDGNDDLRGGSGNDVIYGDGGDDVVDGGDGNDLVYGGEGADRVEGRQGGDRLYGFAGNDTLGGGDGDDEVLGGSGNDVLFGDSGNDLLDGQQGVDSIYGGDGADTLEGRLDRDTLFGGLGDDNVGGGDDDDVVWGGGGNDVVYGDGGNDLVDGQDGDDVVYGGDGADSVEGRQGRDRLFGLAGNDMLGGGDGDDEVSGGSGNDVLYGDGGNDVLRGGAGTDRLSGGSGSDRFDIDELDASVDTITDFARGGGNDVIDVRDVLVRYDSRTSNVNNFVQAQSSGSGVILGINADGIGADFISSITLQGVAMTSALINEMLAQGNLMVV